MCIRDRLVGGLVTPIVSRVADGRHRKSALIGALATIAVGSLIGAAVPTYAGLLVARALHGLGYSLVALTVGIAREHLGGARLQRTMATLSTSLAAGVGLANPLVGLGAVSYTHLDVYKRQRPWRGAARCCGCRPSRYGS